MAGDSLSRFRHWYSMKTPLPTTAPQQRRLARESASALLVGLHRHHYNVAAWIRQIGINVLRPRLLSICSKDLTRSLVDEKSRTPGRCVRWRPTTGVAQFPVPCSPIADFERNTKLVESPFISITHHHLPVSSSRFALFCKHRPIAIYI
jgi:hypothetical protein